MTLIFFSGLNTIAYTVALQDQRTWVSLVSNFYQIWHSDLHTCMYYMYNWYVALMISIWCKMMCCWSLWYWFYFPGLRSQTADDYWTIFLAFKTDLHVKWTGISALLYRHSFMQTDITHQFTAVMSSNLLNIASFYLLIYNHWCGTAVHQLTLASSHVHPDALSWKRTPFPVN